MPDFPARVADDRRREADGLDGAGRPDPTGAVGNIDHVADGETAVDDDAGSAEHVLDERLRAEADGKAHDRGGGALPAYGRADGASRSRISAQSDS